MSSDNNQSSAPDDDQTHTEVSPSKGRPGIALTEGGIRVGFAEHYGRDISDYDFFPMTRKRNFANGSDRAEAALIPLLEDEDFAFGLLSLRYDISLPETEPDHVGEEEFPERLYDLFDERAANRIRALVTAEYAAKEVNIDTEHAGRNEELQFTNEHAQLILQWSHACVAATPLITTLMEERDIEARDGSTLLMNCFGALLRRFEPSDGRTDLLTKLRKLVESRVLQTRYSDRVMWSYLENIATDTSIFIDRLFRKFVTEGIPKLDQGTNIIKFFHGFLRNQIRYQFMAKINISFRPVRGDVMDSEGVSAMEHLETELIRRDEGAAVLSEIGCALAVRDVVRSVQDPPCDEEVEYWSHLLKASGINAWQRGIVTKFFLPAIGRPEAMRTRTLGEYARMLLLTRRWLSENSYPALAAYMGARAVEADGRRLLSRKRFVKEFLDSAQYRELLGSCFQHTAQAIVDSGIIIDMISAVHVNVFERLPEWGEMPADPPVPPERVDYRIETIAQECLRYVLHICRPPPC
jgi:hypothetical protein